MTGGNQEPIAVIGMACRFPGGANSPSRFWELLKSPKDLSKRVPMNRFDCTAYFHPNGSYHGATDSRDAYFLDEDPSRFDNGFFNIQPTEAEAIDPQQRLLLETVYDSLCDGGHTIDQLRGSDTAVYVGMMCDDWAQLISRDWEATPTYAATGESRAIISNRISYYFDWHGPSMTIDTACSSSLVAVHQGVAALRSGECAVAVAAGANLILGPGMWIAESNLHMLSPTGTSKMWDAAADGYARGEGIASIVLKRLSDALRDGDPIDCVIRGSGVNQDGRTAGLTMPSNVAQAELIRQTYSRAGLDINKKEDRPQFFHAHGTGTPAGDPQEAQAIASTFFPGNEAKSAFETLAVGSLKTIIGHTEGTAGLASLIGTCLALKHATIPPNLHFHRLNPRVAPFCTHLEIPTFARSWPMLTPGQPRRASVNSFGFGGTNAHAILESFENLTSMTAIDSAPTILFTPLVISAASSSALRAMLLDLKVYLERHPDTNLHHLCHTLQSRRSTLPYRTVLICRSTSEACSRLETMLAEDASPKSGTTTRHPDVPNARILGVFTGQGAQWARMGARIIESSPYASTRIDELESALQRLPEEDRPDWSLRAELVADTEFSRLSEASIAQPLCTAIQIVLCDLIRAANIQLSGIVGHSSGEIGAAYAAGFLSAESAIYIAYYRGLYAHLARSDGKSKGAMMAAGTTFEDAKEFCELDDYSDRVEVAARNSPTSVTLSGDEDAIEEAKAIFADEKKFARRLLVDVAYHSRHMLPCAEKYREALARCSIVTQDGNGVPWFSSVRDGLIMTKEAVKSKYWVDNMTNTVLFSPALQAAVLEAGPFDLAIEFGPHPALKSPCLDTLQEAGWKKIPYTGLLSRQKDDISELASSLGFVWRQLGATVVDFPEFEKQVSQTTSPIHGRKIIRGLPNYPFDHEHSFSSLTRYSGSSMNAHAPPHPLLGRRSVESETENEVSWRQLLRPSEICWLQGHQLQGQTVFPAMGYVAMAVEAASVIAGPTRTIGLIDLENIVIGRALTFDDDDIGMECKITVSTRKFNDDRLSAQISCYSGRPREGATPLALNFSAQISASFHEPAQDTLPASRIDSYNLVPADADRLYSQFTSLGYNYSKPFTGVRHIQRKMDFATGVIEDESGDDWEDQLLLHPGLLDSAIQTGFAAYCHPYDNRLWALQVPVSIQSIAINPFFLRKTQGTEKSRCLQYQSTTHTTQDIAMVVDIDLFAEGQAHPCVTFQSIAVQPFAAATARDDACVYSRTEYGVVTPDAAVDVSHQAESGGLNSPMLLASERIGFFYLRQTYEAFTNLEMENILPHYQRLLDNVGRILEIVSRGEHATVPREASEDSKTFIRSLIAKYHQYAIVKLLQVVGENLETEIRRGGSMLEHMSDGGLLEQFFEEMGTYPGAALGSAYIDRFMAQLSFRFPRMNILEIRAGGGAATSGILSALNGAYETYTSTDISDEALERANERFENFSDRMAFVKYDIEKTPQEQGFEEEMFDVVIARTILHTTTSLNDVLSNCRRLIKPGGYLIIGDFLRSNLVTADALFGGLPGWCLSASADSNQSNGPSLTINEFNTLAQENDFLCAEDNTVASCAGLQYFSAWTWQAADLRVRSLRNPLTAPDSSSATNRRYLFIVGGRKAAVRTLAADTRSLLNGRYERIVLVGSLEELNEVGLAAGSSVLCLSELDEQLLEESSERKLGALKNLWRNGRTILYVTGGAQNVNPYSGMILGLSRVVRYEYPNISLQVLNFDADTRPTAQTLSESLIRLELGSRWLRDEGASDLLWSLEPELYYSNGQPLIPRLMPLIEANARYNTCRRPLQKVVDPRKEIVVIEPVLDGSIVQLSVPSPLRAPGMSRSGKVRTVQLKYSLLNAVRVGESGFIGLAVGRDIITGEPVLAWFDALPESRMPIPDDQVVSVPGDVSSAMLLAIAAHLVANSILHAAPQFGSIVAHGLEDAVKSAMHREAALLGRQILFTTGERTTDTKTLVQPMFIHERLPLRMIQPLLPQHVSSFVNATPGCASAEQLTRCLPRNAQIGTMRDFIRASPQTNPNVIAQYLTSVLREASEKIEKYYFDVSGNMTPKLLPISAIGASFNVEANAKLAVVDWESPSVTALVKPIDHGTIFRGDRTYLLFGLAGDLGQSLCTWMVAHGARHIVLGSRQPKVGSQFIDSLKASGATIKVKTVDLTSRKSVYACVDSIQNEMPPVGGVANGALVLEDVLFDDLDFVLLDRTAKPKVDGSLILDELFYETPLEFFILFTSAVGVSGNTGQSAYIMANNFMTSLAAQRRDRRGVAGSAIALGAVAGLGRFERSGHLDRDHFTKMGYRDSSEQDCHRLFAEAIWSGRPENASQGCSQVCSGLSHVRKTPELQAQLREDPRFSHFMQPDAFRARQAGSNNGGSAARPRVRLGMVTSRAEARSVIREAFITRLKRILMVHGDEQLNTNVTFVEQGLDSIMAVEVRTWFLSEVEVDLPVLQILGPGATVDALVDGVMEKIPASILDWGKLEDGQARVKAAEEPVANPSKDELPVVVNENRKNDVLQKSEMLSSSGDSLESQESNSSSPPLLTPRADTPCSIEPSPGVKPSHGAAAERNSVLNPRLDDTIAVHSGFDEDQKSVLLYEDRKRIADSSTELVAQMTFGQKGIWLLSHYVDDPATFNMSVLLKLTGPLQIRNLAKAVESVAQRHEALRTRFFWSDDEEKLPMQGILSKPLMRLEMANIANHSDALEQLEAMQSYEWDLNDWLAVRLRVLCLSDTEHYLLMGANHIVLDGHSYTIMMLDIEKAYMDPGQQLPQLPEASQIRAFGAQEHMVNGSGHYRPSLECCRHLLDPKELLQPIDLLSFARTRVRLPLTRYNTHVSSQPLDPRLASSLNKLARRHGATSFHVYLAALQALLFRLLPRDTTEKVFIGMADANRHDSRFMGSIGNFLNLLPLKFTRRDSQSFGEAVETACAEVHRAIQNSLPFDLLLEEMDLPRSSAWSPIFQVFIDYRLVPSQAGGRTWSGCRVTGETWRASKSAYDIVLEVAENKNETLLKMHMQAGLYSAEGAELFLRSYVNLLEHVAQLGDGTHVENLPRWSDDDIAKAVEIGQGQGMQLEWPATVAHRIEQMTALYPDSTAIKDGHGIVLTYSELDRRIESIALLLRDRLPAKGDKSQELVVAVFQMPTADYICSLLAIHRVGAVYLPLDIRNGPHRLKSNVKVARPVAILVDSETANRVGEIGVDEATIAVINVLKIAISLPRTRDRELSRSVAAAKPEDTAYIIFTSGSSGEPKGITVTHDSLRANLEGYHRAWEVDKLANVMLQQSLFSFDASLLQIYAPLTTGGCLLVAPADARGDPHAITRLMVDHGVTMTQATPSEYDMWFTYAPENLRKCSAWKAAWFGGERAASELLDGWRQTCKDLPNLRVFTSYGPTECTISATKGEVDLDNPEVTVPVPGQLLPNYKAFIVDDDMNPVPIGVAGEILLGGVGVAGNKYLDRPDLTAGAFQNAARLTRLLSRKGPCERVYRTGDYGRLGEDGRLTVEGRIAGDTQVKLRGFRIELEEIERVIVKESAGQVKAAILTLREDIAKQREAFLAAHIVLGKQDGANRDNSIRLREVINKLRLRLPLCIPPYMCPAVIVPLDCVPLTAHAKADRKAVQELPLQVGFDKSLPTDEEHPTLTPTEYRLAHLWTEVLPPQHAPLAPASDFFLCGGNSLVLVKLQGLIKRDFSDAPRLIQLMNASSLASMVALINISGTSIDWNKEIGLDVLEQTSLLPPSRYRKLNQGHCILVTGATGHIGRRIVTQLAKHKRVRKIVCLVRPAEGRDLSTLFPGMDKVQTVLNELPSIPANAPELSEVTTVLHCAANRTFWDGYIAAKPVNVEAVKELTKLCLRIGAHLHILSSGNVSAYESDASACDTFLPRPNPDDGYIASKWVAERYLASAARQLGLRATVHRLSQAPPTDGTGMNTVERPSATKAEAAIVSAMLRVSARLNKRPDFERIDGGGWIDVTPLTELADAVTPAVATETDEGQQASVRILSYPASSRVRTDVLASSGKALLEEMDNKKSLLELPPVSALHFIGLAKRAGLFDWAIMAQELTLVDENGQRIMTRR